MGWLGWPPDVVFDTNVNHLNLAIAGKIDFVQKTNPWGSAEEKAEDPGPGNPERAALDIMQWAKRQQSKGKGGRRR